MKKFWVVAGTVVVVALGAGLGVHLNAVAQENAARVAAAKAYADETAAMCSQSTSDFTHALTRLAPVQQAASAQLAAAHALAGYSTPAVPQAPAVPSGPPAANPVALPTDSAAPAPAPSIAVTPARTPSISLPAFALPAYDKSANASALEGRLSAASDALAAISTKNTCVTRDDAGSLNSRSQQLDAATLAVKNATAALAADTAQFSAEVSHAQSTVEAAKAAILAAAHPANVDPRCIIWGTAVCASKTTNTVYYVVNGNVIWTTAVNFAGYACELPVGNNPPVCGNYNTDNGVFAVYSRVAKSWSNPYKVWMYYSLYFNSGDALHFDGDFPSHGCIHIHSMADAEWLFNNSPVGTRVVVY